MSDNNNNSNGHKPMLADYRKRTIISLFLAMPILVLSPMIQGFLNYQVEFAGSKYVLFIFSTVIFFYGGWPFITSLYDEIREKTLV